MVAASRWNIVVCAQADWGVRIQAIALAIAVMTSFFTGLLLFEDEDVFNRPLEEAGDFVCEWEAWVVFLDFERVDGLATHAEVGRQIRLRPVVFSAQDAEAILHV
jgi:hypothetical protein